MKGIFACVLVVFCVALAWGGSSQAIRPNSSEHMKQVRSHLRELNKEGLQGEGVYKPGKWLYFEWDDEHSEWVQQEVWILTYYDDGKLKSAANSGNMTEYVYNTNGQLAVKTIYKLGFGAPEIYLRYSYEYDDVVTDFVVLETCYSPYYGTEVFGTEITRDGAGNVSNVRDYSVYDDEIEYDDEWVEIVYNGEGKAKEITQYAYPYYIGGSSNKSDTVMINHKLYNIEWENTDGQIFTCYDELYFMDSPFYYGSNRIRSATYDDKHYPEAPKISVDYVGKSFNQKVMVDGKIMQWMKYDEKDDNGSYTLSHYDENWAYRENEGQKEYYVCYSVQQNIELAYDEYGNILRYENKYYRKNFMDEGRTIYSLETGVVTYDDTYGYPIEYIGKEAETENAEPVNAVRFLWSDYIPFSGVENIVDDTAAGAVEYYDIHGMKVKQPARGFYIVRKGGNTFKVMF